MKYFIPFVRCISLWLFWLAFFVMFKILFILFNHSVYFSLPLSEIVGVLLHGIRMDASAAGYLSIIPVLSMALLPWIDRVLSRVVRIYGIVVLPVLVLMGCVDMATFSDWQIRLNVSILKFFNDPIGVYQSLSAMQWLSAFFVYAILLWFSMNAYFKVCDYVTTPLPGDEKSIKIKQSLLVVLSGTLLIAPIRGTIGNAPMNPSIVSFSPKLVCNYGAYNFFWNFVYTAINKTDDTNPLCYMTDDEASTIFEASFADKSCEVLPVPHISRRGNVVFIILESFSSHLIGALTPDGEDVCPRLSELCKSGICFSRFYASGHRSDQGVSAILCGYPSLINYSSILGDIAKMQTVRSLPRMFSDAGYTTHCIYGGDIDFYNTKVFLLNAGVQRITERGDFPLSVSRMQKWGAPDEYLYARYLQELDSMPQPFFSVCYNISSHPPFDTPSSFARYKGADSASRVKNAMAYSDSCLGVFIDSLRAMPMWDSTLVVITSDHTASLHEFGIGLDDAENYRIPLLLTGGVVDTAYVCDMIGSQTDLCRTLCPLELYPEDASRFSRQLFDGTGYAFVFRNELWAFVSDSYSFVVNRENNHTKFWYDSCQRNDSVEYLAKAYAQYVLSDYLKRK